ncbi:MAG: aldo/keto reductase [Cyclobacteriaceae bacterium]
MEKKIQPTEKSDVNRREFIKKSASLAALMSMPTFMQPAKSDSLGMTLPTRKLGSTGLDATIFCLGGGPVPVPTGSLAGDLALEAINGGCRFFETARQYGGGKGELAWGKYLIPKYRKDIILMSKSPARTAEDLNKDLETSLEALQTDYLDIYMMHGIGSKNDVDGRFKGGVYDALLKAKADGKVRHIGFSGHRDPEAHNYLINKNLPDLEVVIFPINLADPHRKSFILNTLPLAVKRNMGVMAMKVFGGGSFIGEKIVWGTDRGQVRESIMPELVSSTEAQHFSLSLPITTTSIGCTKIDHVKEAIANAKSYSGMTEAQRTELSQRIKHVYWKYTMEHYKAAGS